MDMISLLYEAGAILIISVAVLVLRFKPKLCININQMM